MKTYNFPKLMGIDPDFYFVIWFMSHADLVTDNDPLVKGWCVYREIPLDF